LPAGFVDGLAAAGPEEELVGLAAGSRVAAEEGADVALKADVKGQKSAAGGGTSEGHTPEPSLIPDSATAC